MLYTHQILPCLLVLLAGITNIHGVDIGCVTVSVPFALSVDHYTLAFNQVLLDSLTASTPFQILKARVRTTSNTFYCNEDNYNTLSTELQAIAAVRSSATTLIFDIVVDETGFPLSSGLETFIANAVKSTMASGKLGDSLINYSNVHATNTDSSSTTAYNSLKTATATIVSNTITSAPTASPTMAPFVLDRTHSDLSSPDSGAVIGVVAAFGFSVLGMIVYLLYTGADSSHGHSPAAVPTEPAEPAVAH